MNKTVKVIVIRTAGTNCNEETAFAFEQCGAVVDQVHIKQLVDGNKRLSDYHILAIPGGFSYGDDIASGRILANQLRLKLGNDIKQFVKEGKLIIGICNGFQILVKAGILPGLNLVKGQEATLFHNDSAQFESRWVNLTTEKTNCVWTKGLEGKMYLPVAHGEGKFIPANQAVMDSIKLNHQIVFRYVTSEGNKPAYPANPNGSTDDIAGICDTTGRILGLMPHPERHFLFEQHPYWTRLKYSVIPAPDKNIRGQAAAGILGEGAAIFYNGVQYAKEHLL